jgi:hypothetical protein
MGILHLIVLAQVAIGLKIMEIVYYVVKFTVSVLRVIVVNALNVKKSSD